MHQPDQLGLELNDYVNDFGNNISCKGGSDGSIQAVVTGGITFDDGSYNYTWEDSFGSTISTAPTAAGLIAGEYTCTITDANGCTITDDVELNEPDYVFDPRVITTNYGGPGNQTLTVEFLDQTTDGNGPVTTLFIHGVGIMRYIGMKIYSYT